MIPEPRTNRDVFIDGVRDALNGTPNASHPVQFVRAWVDASVAACTLCGALVLDTIEWTDLHRSNHDLHNTVHAVIEEAAKRYVPPPRYG